MQILVAVKRGSPLAEGLSNRAMLMDAVEAACQRWEFPAAALVSGLFRCSFRLGVMCEDEPGAPWRPWQIGGGTAQDPKARRLRLYLDDNSVQES